MKSKKASQRSEREDKCHSGNEEGCGQQIFPRSALIKGSAGANDEDDHRSKDRVKEALARVKRMSYGWAEERITILSNLFNSKVF